jgi:outer membrane receptor protein involved in Fe transport
MKKRLRFERTILAAAIAAAVGSGAGIPRVSWAQTADATLRGTTAANAEVVAKNIATGVTRRTKAAEDGSYTIPGLQPGTYRVDAGPGTETTITLTVASTATVDLAAGTSEAAATGTLEEVTVRSKRIIETRTSEVGETVSLQVINTVPQLTRNFLEFADTVPGMIFSVNSQGQTSLTGGAQSPSSVNVYIDGVGQKNYVKEGGVSGQFFTQGNPFPQLAIGEYKVITSNYKAEFDQVSSAAVVAGTKSGTNDFHGEVYGQYTSTSLRAETPQERHSGKKITSADKEFGASFGGPIIQDKLHFFVTYEGKRYNTPIAVTPGVTTLNGVPIATLLPASVAAQLGAGSLPFQEDEYFGKLDFEPTDSDRFETSIKYRKESQIENIGPAEAASSAISVLNNDTRFTLRWQHSADHWFNELVYTHQATFNAPSSLGLGNGAHYIVVAANNQNILDTGPASPLATQDKGQQGPGIQDDFTWSDLHWLGDHTIKTGVKYQSLKLVAADAEDINPQFNYNVTPAGTAALPYEAQFTNPVAGLSPTARSKDDQLGLYLQDDWVQNQHLTWNLGVRWDYEKNLGFLNYVTPANVVAALNGPDPSAPGQTYAQSLALGGVNVNDYISNGHNRKAPTNEIQPRLGFSVDLNADQRHVVFGGYGRSYDRDLYDYLQVEQTKQALPYYSVYFPNPGGTIPPNGCFGAPCVAWNPAYLTGLSNLQALVGSSNLGAEVDAINNNLKVPYSDQFSIGMRNTLGEWNTSAAIARIISKDGFVFTLGNRYPSGAFWVNGGQPWGHPVPGFGNYIIGSNGIETKTIQVLLSADKPFTAESHWGVTFAYTYTSASQNRDITQHYAFDEETIAQYPFINSNAAPRHRIVSTGTYGLPWDLIVSAKLTLATPTPVTDLACDFSHPTPPYATGSFCTPISATPKNFLGYRTLDLQVTKNFQISHFGSAYIRLDGLNVFNYRNYSDTNKNWFTNGVANSEPVTYDRNGNIFGVPRTLKLMVGAKF